MTTKLSLKLIVDASREKLLYAETDKDFVDFLFNIFTLPLGTLISVLQKEGTMSFFGALYKSVGKLPSNSYQSNMSWVYLLWPSSSFAENIPPLLPINYYGSKPKLYKAKEDGGGYVRRGTYIVMDDLGVLPESTSTVLSLFSKFDVKDHKNIVERVVTFGKEEAMKLLKASMSNSEAILSDLYLNKVKQEE